MADSNMHGGVKQGATSLSWSVVLRRATDGTEHTGLTAAQLTISYWRQGGGRVAVAASDLPSITSPFNPGGVKEVDPVNIRGAYRIDWPDAAFVAGADWVQLTVQVAGDFAYNERIPLSTVTLAPSPSPSTPATPGTLRVLDVITAALIKLRVHRAGADVPPEDAQDAADELRRLLGTWQVEGSLVYRVQEQICPLTPGKATYTIGPGGDIDTPRPVALHDAFTRIGSTDYPYTVVHAELWTLLHQKSQSGTWPQWVYYEPAYPLGVIHCWPVPTVGVLSLLLDQPLTTLGLNDTVSMPPGYEDALVLCLGKRLAPSYGQSLTAEYVSDYTLAMRALTRANKRPVIATLRLPVTGRRATEASWIYHG